MDFKYKWKILMESIYFLKRKGFNFYYFLISKNIFTQ